MKALKWNAALVALVLAAACVTTVHALAATPARIDIKEFKFAPPAITVRPGTKVTWVNHDEEPHTVTSATGGFGSAGLSLDETFTQTFTRRGTYQYFCALHPFMKATVIVK
jgi:plastocyanin